MKVQDVINCLEKVLITEGNMDIKVAIYSPVQLGDISSIDHIAIDDGEKTCVIAI